jgi:hypothetical protein
MEEMQGLNLACLGGIGGRELGKCLRKLGKDWEEGLREMRGV